MIWPGDAALTVFHFLGSLRRVADRFYVRGSMLNNWQCDSKHVLLSSPKEP